MSAMNKLRANLKSGGDGKVSSLEPANPTIVQVASQKEPLVERPPSIISLDEADDRNNMDFEDDASFDSYMIKPSNLRDIWSISQVKKKMFEYIQWYFRPKNSYEPERVDYNALNILAEYQTYNLEFVKNELDLNDEQTANVLQALWSLLEFDPDEKSIVQEID